MSNNSNNNCRPAADSIDTGKRSGIYGGDGQSGEEAGGEKYIEIKVAAISGAAELTGHNGGRQTLITANKKAEALYSRAFLLYFSSLSRLSRAKFRH